MCAASQARETMQAARQTPYFRFRLRTEQTVVSDSSQRSAKSTISWWGTLDFVVDTPEGIAVAKIRVVLADDHIDLKEGVIYP